MTTVAGAVVLAVADGATLRRHAGVLEALAAQHGLSNLRLGPAPGEIVVTVGRGRDGFDMADFEIEAENVVRALVTVTSDRAPGAHSRGRPARRR